LLTISSYGLDHTALPEYRCLLHYARTKQRASTTGVRPAHTIRAGLNGQKRGGSGLVPGSGAPDEELVKPA
jgi:hypothetical protein